MVILSSSKLAELYRTLGKICSFLKEIQIRVTNHNILHSCLWYLTSTNPGLFINVSVHKKLQEHGVLAQPAHGKEPGCSTCQGRSSTISGCVAGIPKRAQSTLVPNCFFGSEAACSQNDQKTSEIKAGKAMFKKKIKNLQQWGRDHIWIWQCQKFPVASRPSHPSLAKHPLWWAPGVASSKVGHSQFRVWPAGLPTVGCLNVGMGFCIVMFWFITTEKTAIGIWKSGEGF